MKKLLVKFIYNLLKLFYKKKSTSHTNVFNKIIIFLPNGIGNVLMHFPALQYLKIKTNYQKIIAITPSYSYPLLKEHFHIDEYIFWDKYKSFIKKVFLIYKLRKYKFDLLIKFFPFKGLWVSIIIALIKSKNKISFYDKKIPEMYNLDFSFLYNFTIDDTAKQHDVELNLYLLTQFFNDRFHKPKFRVPIKEKFQKEAFSFLNEYNINNNTVLVGFAIGSKQNTKYKRWELEKYIKLGNYIANQYNAKILLLGGPDEFELLHQAHSQIKNSIVPDKIFNLNTIMAIIKRCNLFISNDSALMHFAAATNTPVIAIFGPTNYKRTGPYSPNSINIFNKIKCYPCYDKGIPTECKLNAPPPCIKQISVAEVQKAVDSILKGDIFI